MLQLERVRLVNVRCFEQLDIRLADPSELSGWTLVLGDNATGKSTLLRSIAMGLCDEASAAGLLKESDEGYIRRGASEARITLWLRDTRTRSPQYRITTTVSRQEKRRGIFTDQVRQKTFPSGAKFPWDELFVSGYGAGRGVTGTGDISSYATIDAVYNLFNYSEGLQNPELVIRRLLAGGTGAPMVRRQVFRLLCEATKAEDIRLTSSGIRVDGPWGQGMPLRDLADGYKSAFLWITDLIGWALTFRPKLRSTAGIRGIVVVDELEQHLHARWQRSIVHDLRALLPNIQFIVATHSPLIASSIGTRITDNRRDRLYVLAGTGEGQVEATPHEFMYGWRMDQVLASRAFKYQVGAGEEVDEMLRRGSQLAGKKLRTPKEETTYQQLKELFQDSFYSSTWPIEREAEQEAKKRLHDEIRKLERDLEEGKES